MPQATSNNRSTWQQWSQLMIGQTNWRAGALNTISLTLTPKYSLANITLRLSNLTGGKVICHATPAALAGGPSSPLTGVVVVAPSEALSCQPVSGQVNPVCTVVGIPSIPNLLNAGGTVLRFSSVNVPQVL
jgi:hypothetical protein